MASPTSDNEASLVNDLAPFESAERDQLLSRIESLLAERRPADALELVDTLDEPTPYLVRIWMQVGSRRALRAIEGPLAPELAEARDRFIDSGPGPLPIPTGEREELSAHAADLGARGLVHELAFSHLGLAELDLRVDERLAHIEAAQALAQQLDDPALMALTAAYEARLYLHLGEDDDARDPAEAARALALAHGEPRAEVMASVVLAALAKDNATLAELRPRLAQLGLDPDGFGLAGSDKGSEDSHASPAGPEGEGD